ncbi:MAG TPA: hypothetical protein PL158_04730, partial [Bacillota bacterium]|nr:hypothetical protein [Bacillota bacterium]
TRAKQRLYVTHAGMRVTFGNYSASVPSRFLMEFPKESIINLREPREFEFRTRTAIAPGPKINTGVNLTGGQGIKRQLPSESKSQSSLLHPDEIVTGCKVKHSKWGIGTVVTKHGEGPEAQVRVAFPDLGIKTLILAYANLEKVD